MDKPITDAILKRLLGPPDHEVLCDECFEKLDVYVDFELKGAPADELVPGMRAHLEGCPACHEEYASLREIHRDRRAPQVGTQERGSAGPPAAGGVAWPLSWVPVASARLRGLMRHVFEEVRGRSGLASRCAPPRPRRRFPSRPAAYRCGRGRRGR